MLDRVAPISSRGPWRRRLIGGRARRRPALHVLARPGELLAGGVAAIALPLLVFALDVPTWLAIALAVAIYAGLMLLRPSLQRRPAARDTSARRPPSVDQTTLADVPRLDGVGPDGQAGIPASTVDGDEPVPALGAGPAARSPDCGEAPHKSLTPRQLEVLRIMADGRSNQEIADALFISLATAKSHVTVILATLGVPSRAAAIVYAHQHGLV